MTQKLKEVLDVGELEGREPAAVEARELVIDDHEEGDEQVCCSQGSKTDESLLADAGPLRMAEAKEDGLADVSFDDS